MDSVMRNHQEERTFAGMFLHEINGSLRQIDDSLRVVVRDWNFLFDVDVTSMPVSVRRLVKLVGHVIIGVVHSADIHPLAKMSRHVALLRRFQYSGHRDFIVPPLRPLNLREHVENMTILCSRAMSFQTEC